MKTLFNRKNLLVATAIAGLAYGSSAMAAFDIQALAETKGGFADRDLENGQVVNASLSATGTKIVLINNGQEIEIVDSPAVKNDVNLSNGIVYWTEVDRVDGEFIDTLYSYDNGAITAVTDSVTGKEGFSYDDNGNVAWVEWVDGANELFFYDGVSITQVTEGHTGFQLSSFSKNITVADGKIVWGESNTLLMWDGQNISQISPADQTRQSWASFDGDSVVWTGTTATTINQVFQYKDGVVTLLTDASNSPDGSKTNARVEEGVITYQRVTSFLGSAPDELYVIENGESVLLTSVSVNDAQVDDGKIYWTEGTAADTPSSLFEHSNGVTTQIETDPGLIIGLEADNGYIIWNTVAWPAPTMVVLASPVSDDDDNDTVLVNLGGEHSVTTLDLSEDLTIEVSAWSAWTWTPGVIGFGFTSADQYPLDGVVAFDADGNSYDLSGYWSPMSLPFNWEPVQLTIPAQPGRSIRVQWWAAGE